MQRAREAGVSVMVVTGTSERASQNSARFAEKHPGFLYSTAGVHPHDAKNCTPKTIQALEALVKKKPVVAVGECGLDFNRDFSPRPVQEKWFEAQIELACKVKMPLFLHERDAHQRFLEILKPYEGQYKRAVVHCFTGSIYEAKRYLDMGLYIGITGWICDERRGKHLREIVKQIPLDHLMLETDAPFLAPVPRRGKRNEPSYVDFTAKEIARLRKIPFEEVARQTTENAKILFGLQPSMEEPKSKI